MNTFINDWHIIIPFGIHRGKRLIDAPGDYFEWAMNNVKYGPLHEAIFRINNRKSVTQIIKNQITQYYIPHMLEDVDNVLPIINRPNDIDFSLFGSFIEFLIKYNFGIEKFDEVDEYLACFGLAAIPDNLKLIGKIESPDTRAKYIVKSYNKKKYNPLDICNLSFTHALLMNSFDENEGQKLFHYVSKNVNYFEDYILVLKNFVKISKISQEEQETCDKISVGCVIGVIDLIIGTNIIDIKCCSKDDINYYRKQLFAYACLHRLRYGKKMTHCKVFNFMTGKIFVMDIQNIPDDIVLHHIETMGNHCNYHTKLFNG